MNRFDQYIDDVLSGKAIVGKLTRLMVERHLADLKRDWNYRFDRERADKAIRFAEVCRHWKGDKAGEKIVLEPFQVFRRGLLYGWRDEKDNRRFTISYYEVARKNAKTTEAAIDAIFHVMAEEAKGAQVLCGATKEGQARIVVNDIGRIVEATPQLKNRFKMFYHTDEIKRVVYSERASYIAPIGRDSRTSDGWDPSQGIIDEYHEHPTDKVLNVIQSGQGARSNPLMNIITTAGFNKESPCYRLRKVGIDILEGKLENDRMLVAIYTMDEEDDWKDPVNWIKANPNLEVSVNRNYLEDRFKQATIQGGEKEVDFITKNLNCWMDAPEVWIADDTWNSLKGEMPPDGATCYGGLDLAVYLDINAFALYFPDYKYLKLYFWVPKDKLKNQKEADYYRWVQDGWMKACEGQVIDHTIVRNDILELSKKYDLKGIAADRFLLYHTTITNLTDEGVTILEHGQGFNSMHLPTMTFEEMAIGGELKHDGSPVMRWMISNVVLERNATGWVKVSKGKASGKIDGVVAGIMALGLGTKPEERVEQSIYNTWEDEGL